MNKSTSVSQRSTAPLPATGGDLKQPQKAKRSRYSSTLGKKTTAEANRRAAVILEVLAGERLPSEAAKLLGVSVTHYYILERKALEGLVAACERKPKGPPGPTAQQQVARLQRELAQRERECQRQAALVRTTQRALGLPAPASAAADAKGRSGNKKGGSKGTASAKKRRRRRATVRALRAAKTLEKNSSLSNRPDELQQLAAATSTGSSQLAQEER